MKVILIFGVASTLGFLSILHIYWAMGGKWAIEGTIPSKYHHIAYNKKYITVMSFMTYVVAVFLLFFSLILISNAINILGFNEGLINYLTTAIGAIFIIRAIGDFNNFGIFKSKSKEAFAINDTKIFVPLCTILGLSTLIINFI